MSIGTVTVNVNGIDVEVGIDVAGVSEVQNINGKMECHLSLRPILPTRPDGPGGGEPLPIPRAA